MDVDDLVISEQHNLVTEQDSGATQFSRTEYEVYFPVDQSKSAAHTDVKVSVQHAKLTTLRDVGLQLWRGSFLLADYLIHSREYLRNVAICELGCGVGLTALVLLGLEHKGAIATDYLPSIVDLSSQNITDNRHVFAGAALEVGEVHCAVLDWMDEYNPRLTSSASSCSTASWESRYTDIISSNNVLFIAADVTYNEDLTKSFFLKCSEFMKPGEHLWLSLEKRFNFSLEHLDLSAYGYDTLLKHINANTICVTSAPSFLYSNPFTNRKVWFSGTRIRIDFPQRCLDYNRVQELELWDITLKELDAVL